MVETDGRVNEFCSLFFLEMSEADRDAAGVGFVFFVLCLLTVCVPRVQGQSELFLWKEVPAGSVNNRGLISMPTSLSRFASRLVWKSRGPHMGPTWNHKWMMFNSAFERKREDPFQYTFQPSVFTWNRFYLRIVHLACFSVTAPQLCLTFP